jgi:hypothetical protein
VRAAPRAKALAGLATVAAPARCRAIVRLALETRIVAIAAVLG